MSALFDLQASFIDALRRPEEPVPASVAQKDGALVRRRFDVYRNNVAAGMIEALRATFPAVDRLVGSDFFAACARVYIDQRPPRSPLLFRYGIGFGDFLESFPPAAKLPYLGDVARLEWMRLQAYHAADVEPLSIQSLGDRLEGDGGGDVDFGSLQFILHPSLSLLRSRFPVVSLWAASTGLGSPEDVDMAASERALVIRPALTVETHALPEDSFAFMSALDKGAALDEAAASALGADDGVDLATHLKGLFAIGAVSAMNDA